VQPRYFLVRGERKLLSAFCIPSVLWQDRTYQNLHRRLAGPHLLHERVEGAKYRARRLVAPDVIGPQVHHDDVGLGLGEPAHELVLPRNIRGEEPTVALVLPVVGEATTLAGQRPDKVRVLDAGVLEVPPEEGSPASLLAFLFSWCCFWNSGALRGLVFLRDFR